MLTTRSLKNEEQLVQLVVQQIHNKSK